MKIGIIKVFLPTIFRNSQFCSTIYNVETINLIKALPAFSSVDLLSANDLEPDEIVRYEDQIILTNKYYSLQNDLTKYDKIFILNSKSSILETDDRNTRRLFEAEVNKYIKQMKLLKQAKPSVQINYIITDMPLFDQNIANVSDNVLTQSADGSYFIPSSFEQLCTLGETLAPVIEKDIHAIYIGNDRNRKDKMMEYFGLEGLQLYGNYKADDPIRQLVSNEVKPIDFPEVYSYLSRTKYTIVISDKEYRAHNFFTMRYYEAIMNNCIAFIDSDYDKGFYLLPEDHFRRVRSLEELQSKIHDLESFPSLYEEVLKEQQDEFENISKNIKNKFRELLNSL